MKSLQVLTSASLTSLQTRRVLIVGTVSSALLQKLLRRDGAMLRYSNRSDGQRTGNANATTRPSDRCESSGARAHNRHTGTVADNARSTVTPWPVYLWSVGGELRLATEPQCARNGSRCSLAQQLMGRGRNYFFISGASLHDERSVDDRNRKC